MWQRTSLAARHPYDRAVRAEKDNGMKRLWPGATRTVGRFPTYLFRPLYAFQSGTREGAIATLMKPIVAGLSRRDMIDLAAYVGSLSP